MLFSGNLNCITVKVSSKASHKCHNMEFKLVANVVLEQYALGVYIETGSSAVRMI